MRIGVSLPNVGLNHGKEMLLPVAEAAERLGFDSVFAAHHVALPYERESQYPYQGSGTEIAMTPGMQWLDPLVTLALIAGATDRVRLGTSVLVLPYRNPINLAAEVASLDAISDGRVILGVGAGWMREEFETLGLDPSERGARTDEYIQVMRCLWSDDPASFDGRFMSFAGTALAARPRTDGGPPIWVGGNTEPGLRRALRHGDGWHGFEVYPEDMPEIHEQLERIGGEVGRDPAELELSVARGLIPPGREEEFLRPGPPDAGRIGRRGGRGALELRGAGRRPRPDPGQLAAPAGARSAGVGRGGGAAAAFLAPLHPPRGCSGEEI